MREKFKFVYGQGNLYFNRSLVIYTEHEYSRGINEFLQENYDALAARFASHGMTFLYIPRLSFIVDSSSLAYITGRHDFQAMNPVNTGDALRSALPEGVYEKLLHPSLTRFGEFEVEGFRLDNFDSPEEAFNAYFEDIEKEHCSISINYQLADDCEMMAAEASEPPAVDEQMSSEFNSKVFDFLCGDPCVEEVDRTMLAQEINEPDDRFGNFSEEDWLLIEQARDNVRQLLGKGISIELIYSLIKPQLTPSRLVVTKDFRVLLPDFDNLEINLGPIDKTVFFFYLRHPEGVNFKDLVDHREEFCSIYRKVTNRKASIFSPIDALVDPTNNSINEKCSHIRRVFLASLAVPLASQYYIVGSRGEDKRIELDRSLVEWECEL